MHPLDMAMLKLNVEKKPQVIQLEYVMGNTSFHKHVQSCG